MCIRCLRVPHVHCRTSWSLEVIRTPKSWQEKGTALRPNTVQHGRSFKAPSAKLVGFWCGGPEESDCKMLSTVCYEKMCGETAKRMCAALGSSRGTVQKIEAELCKSAPTYRTTEINSLYT